MRAVLFAAALFAPWCHALKNVDYRGPVVSATRNHTGAVYPDYFNEITCDARPLRRYALAFFGGVSRLKRAAGGAGSNVFEQGDPINVTIVANAYRLHLFEGRPELWDVFIHSWSWNLQSQFEREYKPVAMHLEANSHYEADILKHGPKSTLCNTHDIEEGWGAYCRYPAASGDLSRKFVLNMVAQREDRCRGAYHKIIVTRPDVISWKTFGIYDDRKYDPRRVTVNNNGQNGDFHWVMGSPLARKFSRLYDSLGKGRKIYYGHVRDFIKSSVTPGQPIGVDDLRAGWDQEVYRKLLQAPPFRKNYEALSAKLGSVGFTQLELEKLRGR